MLRTDGVLMQSFGIESDAESTCDPYRALAAAIVWRAVLDAFYANDSQGSCQWCRAEAYEWLLSDDGRRMGERAGLDAAAMLERLRWLRRERLYIRPRSKGIVWVRRG